MGDSDLADFTAQAIGRAQVVIMLVRRAAILWVLLILLPGGAAWADGLTAPSGVSLFDPARHMRVSEVRPGMTGYGLTVFSGSKIEKFNVEVVSVLKNFNPQYDVVLIRCKGDYLEHTGSIAGMSGSPVYLKDDQGRYRMIGAFAYGWPLTKDPVAGVQPIEYMLALPAGRLSPTTAQSTSDAGPSAGAEATPAAGRMSWSFKEAGLLARPGHRSFGSDFNHAEPAAAPADSSQSLLGDGQALPRLQPLTTPLMVSGLSPQLIAALGPRFKAMGLTLLEAGGGSSQGGDVKLEPGSVLAVPLLTGDADMTAIGTCTEVIGDRMWGFGHPFNNEGSISLPMGSGQIQGVIANLETSFKLGTMSSASGTLTTDMAVGVAGRVGPLPRTVPIDFRISYAGSEPARSYHFDSALNPKFTPLIAGAAFAAAITGTSDLPQYNTVDYDLSLEFANGQTLDMQNRAVNAVTTDLFAEIGIPMTAAAENPFERVMLRRIKGDIHISPVAHGAQLIDVTVPKDKYRPGDTLKAFATYKPLWGEEGILPIEMDLPRDLPKGTYRLIISDSGRYVQDEQQMQPFRFTAESVGDVFAVLKDLAAIRDDALYVRLVCQPDGVAIGRTALQRLPSSRRQILMGAGRSATTAFVSSMVKVIPTQDVMSGAAEFAITIDTSPKATLGGPHPGNPENQAPNPKADQPKSPAPAAADTPAH